MSKNGEQVKYGYILLDNISPTDKMYMFYKAKTFTDMIDHDDNIDIYERYFLRVEIPTDMKYIKHNDINDLYEYYIVCNDYRKKIKELHPMIVYRVEDRGFRVATKLTRAYINQQYINISDIFYGKIKLTGKGRTRNEPEC